VPDADDARVATVPLRVPRRDRGEELRHDLGLHDETGHVTASGEIPLLAERDHALGEAAGFLRLRDRGLDALVLEQRRHQVAQERMPVLALASQLAMVFTVSHGLLCPLVAV
jgi:hypothetical protein